MQGILIIIDPGIIVQIKQAGRKCSYNSPEGMLFTDLIFNHFLITFRLFPY